VNQKARIVAETGYSLYEPVAKIRSPFAFSHKARRAVWNAVWLVAFRPSPRTFFAWRRLLLRLFGARIAPTARVLHSTRIWAPWNLAMEDLSILAEGVDCYNVDKVTLGERAIVSQYSCLCTASHDICDPAFSLVTAPIILEKRAWVAGRAMIGMGVTLGEGSVVAMGSVVVKPVEPWTVVGGNPAVLLKRRIVRTGGNAV